MEVRPEPGAGHGADIPTCYRHPGRETYLTCVRCGRPSCPECLRSAAVGHQCVECVKEGNRGVRPPTAVFGGRVPGGATVTWLLVGLTVAVYLAEWVYPAIVSRMLMYGLGVAQGQDYRLISSAFVHQPGLTGFGPLDIAFNMWALILVGPALERLVGHWRFLVIYLLSAVGGSVAFYYFAPPLVGAVGASGAIFGLFGAWFVVAKRLQLDSRMIVFLIVINLVLSFIVPGIAWQAHLGGLVTGGALTAAYAYAPRRSRGLLQAAATVAVIVILVVAVVARNGQLLAGAA